MESRIGLRVSRELEGAIESIRSEVRRRDGIRASKSEIVRACLEAGAMQMSQRFGLTGAGGAAGVPR